MPLDVQLYAGLAPDLPRRTALDITIPASAGQVALMLGIPTTEIYLIVIDGKEADLEDLVPPDGRVCFFPYLSGG
ncbi:MAG TPA: hypothetical protein VGA61_18395 [Anaerolineae bacterium]